MKSPRGIAALLLGALPLACGNSESEKGGGDGSEETGTRTTDRQDPTSTAEAVLEAYKAKDFVALAELSSEGNRGMMEELAEQGERHPRYASMFEGWRWESIQAWDGTIRGTRYRSGDALVHFRDIADDEVAAVVLVQEDGRWCFEDINSPGRSSYLELSESPRD